MSLIERNYHFMLKHIQKVGQVLAFVPLMAIPSSQLALNIGQLPQTPVTKVEVRADELRKEKADAIDVYFKDRSMPLVGSGMTFVLVAEKYGLDYRLLPAIGVRESSGGKAACGYNAFGWGSCKLHNFNSYEEAIEALGKNLGGANASTSRFYAGKTTYEKLYHYNGTVVPTYPDEVITIMRMIQADTN
jgi:hypothetical protein